MPPLRYHLVRIRKACVPELHYLSSSFIQIFKKTQKTSVIFWPSTRPKMAFQGDAPELGDTSEWQLGEEIAWAEIG